MHDHSERRGPPCPATPIQAFTSGAEALIGALADATWDERVLLDAEAIASNVFRRHAERIGISGSCSGSSRRVVSIRSRRARR